MPAPAARAVSCLVAAVTVTLAGCVTGQRPTLSEAPAMTGDAAADGVLHRLDRAAEATFTADYAIVTTRGGVTTAASVAQRGAAARLATIGSVRYVATSDGSSTCVVDGECEDGLDAARVSDLQVTPEFEATSPAARLRTDVGRATGPTVASTATIAGQEAACVTVPLVPIGTTTCALDSGPLARLVAADVMIELISYSGEIDESSFEQATG